MHAVVNHTPEPKIARKSFDTETKPFKHISKPPKSRIFGFEVNKCIIWKDWLTGREYTKYVTLKNLKFKSENISYQGPETQIFSISYPKNVKICPGTSYSIPVTFRPLEINEYKDSLKIFTKEGVISIELKGLLPSSEVELPNMLDFGMCSVNEDSKLTFTIKNTGELALIYSWVVESPFSIVPPEGLIYAGNSESATIHFKPPDGLVYETEIVFKYGDNDFKKVNLRGVGKYPHILVSDSKSQKSVDNDKYCKEVFIDFGSVPVGQTMEKWIYLHNLSSVRAPFTVDYHEVHKKVDTVFSCPKPSGIIEPMTATSIPILYTPKIVDSINIDYLKIQTMGDLGRSVIKCQGQATGPCVKFSCEYVNFKIVNLGEWKTHSCSLINTTSTSAFYEFVTDNEESVFILNCKSGVIKPQEIKTVSIKFGPRFPINYYKRLICLIHNQGSIYLDLLGTCHSDKVQPEIIRRRHLLNYLSNVRNHLSFYAPEKLQEMLENDVICKEDNGALQFSENKESATLCDVQLSSLEEYYSGHGAFVDGILKQHVALDTYIIDFGCCHNTWSIEHKTVYLMNHTSGTVTVNWMTDGKNIFSVFPVTVDIGPEQALPFYIQFNPNVPNMLFESSLECYVSYKSFRDFTIVNDDTFTPPWCLSLTCTGQTFQPGNQLFSPQTSITPDIVIFKPTNLHSSSYNTLTLSNNADTPLQFEMIPPEDGVIEIKPMKGVLAVGECKIFVIKASPVEVRSYKKPIAVKLNETTTVKVDIFVPCETANVLLSNKGEIYFKPTCVGSSSQACAPVRNISRLTIWFEWKLSAKEAEVLSVCPVYGSLKPNEILNNHWIFSPKAEERIMLKPHLLVYGLGESDTVSSGKRKMYSCRVIGLGLKGEIQAAHSEVDFGTVTVHQPCYRNLVLYNNNDCDLHFRLCVKEVTHLSEGGVLMSEKSHALEVDDIPTVLAARSSSTLHLTLTPNQKKHYEYMFFYTPMSNNRKPLMDQSPYQLCSVTAESVYPAIAVVDAACKGSHDKISKQQLWSFFSINRFNELLKCVPKCEELSFSAKSLARYSRDERPERLVIDFDFSAAPIDDDPAVITLMLENINVVPAQWNFLSPGDLQLDLQYWVDDLDYTEDEIREMAILDNKIFVIKPNKGRLMPGEVSSVTLTFYHKIPGINRLPVLFKIKDGREIMINFVGITIEKNQHYLHFQRGSFNFIPMPINTKNNPIQIYELYNGGAIPVHWKVDLTPIDIIKQENYNMEIFECFDPSGTVQPGQVAQVRWRFTPAEIKTYSVDIPLIIEGGESEIVTFNGVGYDRNILNTTTVPMTEAQRSDNVPMSQNIQFPEQIVYLSRECISLGNMPLYSQKRCVLFVMNRSSKDSVCFTWHVNNDTDFVKKCVSIIPESGTLKPKESKLCRLTFTALDQAAFYDFDLICEVQNEREYLQYEKELAAWNLEQYKRQTEFTITEHDLDADRNSHSGLHSEDPSRVLSCSTCSKNPLPIENIKYKTIPPIKLPTVDDWYSVAERRQLSKCKKEVVLPMPPTSQKLHLALTARTHNIQEFQANFPELRKYFYINRYLSDEQRSVNLLRRSAKQNSSISCSFMEKEMLLTVISNILTQLLSDANFNDSLMSIANDEIPYFVQFTKKAHPKTKKKSIRRGYSWPTVLDSKRNVAINSLNIMSHEVVNIGESNARVTKDDLSTATLQKNVTDECTFSDTQDIKKQAEVGHMIENIVENTVLNIMTEAVQKEFSLTTRKCFSAVPKSKNTDLNDLHPSILIRSRSLH